MTLWREHCSGIGEAWVPGLIPNHVTLIQSHGLSEAQFSDLRRRNDSTSPSEFLLRIICSLCPRDSGQK